MDPVTATRTVFDRAFDIHGRAGRSEYWWFWGVQAVLFAATGWFDAMRVLNGAGIEAVLLGATTFLTLFLLIPNVTVAVRRLHDTGKSGIWFLSIFVPVVGPPLFLGLMTLPSDPGRNRFGEATSEAGTPSSEGLPTRTNVPLVRRRGSGPHSTSVKH